MSKPNRTNLIVCVLFLALAVAGGIPRATEAADGASAIALLAPAKSDTQISREIIKRLQQRHYRKVELDDRFSHRAFDRYLAELDSNRSYFLAADVAEFEKYRYRLDDLSKSGNLGPAFKIFNRYQQRLAERLEYLIAQLKCCYDQLDFDLEEYIQIDRSDAQWIESPNAMDALWQRRLKNDVLNLKLEGTPAEDIPQRLIERYRSRLSRLGQNNPGDVIQIYLNAMTQIFDPHTQYFAPRVSENFNIRMSLSLEGIGAILQTENDFTKVVSLVPAGPADKAGQLKPGDRIVAVAQGAGGEMVDVIGWRIDDVVQLIRGPKNTVVRLKIIPADVSDEHLTRTVQITRNTVKLEDQTAQKEVLELDYEGRTYKIGVIDIPTFYVDFKGQQTGQADYRSTTRDVHRLLDELVAEGVQGIVVDLRDNGGGALQEVNSLVGLFIETGPTVQVRNRRGQSSQLADKDPQIVFDGPLCVLVNRLSASASEIFAGAIQDYGRGIVTGSQTFGKGTVQSLLNLEKGQLKLTVAKFYRISGASTQHRGIVPDIIFPSIYDSQNIGESTHPEALPWDTIAPLRHHGKPLPLELVAQIQALHNRRVQSSQEYALLMAELENQARNRLKTKISLQAAARTRERDENQQWRLMMANKRRQAKELKPFATFAEMSAHYESESGGTENQADQYPDPYLTESAYALLDFIRLAPTPRHQIGQR